MIEFHLKFQTGLVVDYESHSRGSEIEPPDPIHLLHPMLLRLYLLSHLLPGIISGTVRNIKTKKQGFLPLLLHLLVPQNSHRLRYIMIPTSLKPHDHHTPKSA
jgi:hypothetical protein